MLDVSDGCLSQGPAAGQAADPSAGSARRPAVLRAQTRSWAAAGLSVRVLAAYGPYVARVNDVGGMGGFGPVEQELEEPPFHSDWEAHVFAMNRALLGAGVYDLNEFRDAIERMDPQEYLRSSYYEKWFHAVRTLCVDKGVLTAQEVAGALLAG